MPDFEHILAPSNFLGYVIWHESKHFLVFNKDFLIIFYNQIPGGIKMRFKTITLIVVTSAIILLMATSCSRYRTHHEPIIITNKSGPPAHAPAHGYRRKHMQMHGVELEFDSGLGLYVVIGHTDHYYHDGYFFRFRGGIWERCPKPDGHWKVVSDKSLPIGLQVKAKAKSNDNGRDKSHGKAKGKNKKDAVSVGKLF